jgi:hypothetical protein
MVILFPHIFHFLAEVAWCELHGMLEALMEKPGNQTGQLIASVVS